MGDDLDLDLEVAHAVLHVCDVDRMLRFYTEVLGFEVTDRGPLRADAEAEIVFLSQTARHHHQLPFIDDRERPGRSENLNHLAFRSSGTLDDLRALHRRLDTDEEVTGIRPLTHGNAWSIYFADPEGNGVEIFIDTPWHVAQPQGKPLDLSLSNEEIEAATEVAFRQEDEFSPIEDFYADRAAHLVARRG